MHADKTISGQNSTFIAGMAFQMPKDGHIRLPNSTALQGNCPRSAFLPVVDKL